MQKEQGFLTISEFSHISEISRKALIFYDKIGVFSPKYTAPNGYRYYAHEQIYIISVINILKELGMPLSKIKEYTTDITPEHALDLLRQQKTNLTKKMENLSSIQDMQDSRLQKLEDGCRQDTSMIRIQFYEETPVFISDCFQAARDRIPDEIWLNFYKKCKQNQVSFGYPEGYLVTQNCLLKQQTTHISNLISYVNRPSYANGIIPAGYYLSAWGSGGLACTSEIYTRLFHFINENLCQICGNAYEERLIDEVGSADPNSQIVQVRIPIEKNSSCVPSSDGKTANNNYRRKRDHTDT